MGHFLSLTLSTFWVHWVTYGIFLTSVSSAQTQKPYTGRCHFLLSKPRLLSPQRDILAMTQGLLGGRAGVLVPTA